MPAAASSGKLVVSMPNTDRMTITSTIHDHPQGRLDVADRGRLTFWRVMPRLDRLPTALITQPPTIHSRIAPASFKPSRDEVGGDEIAQIEIRVPTT